MLIYVGHVISILVFLSVIVTSIYMGVTLKSSTLPPCYLWVPRVVIGLLVMQSSVFLLIQADYLLGVHTIGYLEAIEDPEESIKALYAILNGITLVMFATGVNIFFRWRTKPTKCLSRCPLIDRRARDRKV